MPLLINYEETEIIDYLRLDEMEPIVTTFQKAAESEALTFLNTDFSIEVVNPDGTITTTAQEAPPEVKEWVLNRIAEKYENRGNAKPPDFSILKPYRKPAFKGFENLN